MLHGEFSPKLSKLHLFTVYEYSRKNETCISKFKIESYLSIPVLSASLLQNLMSYYISSEKNKQHKVQT